MASYLYALLALLAVVTADLQAGNWAPQVKLEGSWSQDPVVATDTSGNTVALWCHHDEEHEWIKGALKPAGKNWQEPFFLTDAYPLKSLGAPDVKYDPFGNAVAFWTSEEKNQFTCRMAILPASSSVWTEYETPISSLQGQIDYVATYFAIDSNGNIVLVWQPRSDGKGNFEAARFSVDEQTWTRLGNIVTNRAIFYVSFALDPAGNGVLVWSEGSAWWRGADTVFAATLPKDFGSWSAPTTLYTGSEAWFSKVSVDDAGNFLVTWQALDSEEKRWSIESAILPVGDTVWQRKKVFESSVRGPGGAHFCMQKMDSAGNAVAIWDLSGVMSARFSSKEMQWTAPIEALSAEDEDIHEHFEFGIDPQGNALFIWEEGYEPKHLRAITLGAKNASWSKPTTIGTIHSLDSWPEIACAPDGTCHLLYCDDFAPAYSVEAISGTRLFGRFKGAKR